MENGMPTIAVVENDVAMLRALERLLRAYGYRTEVFGSAEQFLERSSKTVYGCLLLDIDLGGMSGIALQKKLTAEGVAPPIIFITGQSDVNTIEQAVDNGCMAYLYKPFGSGALLSALEKAVNSCPYSPAP